jgi:C_GCAxxG_C_C family probable redox protein
MSKSETAASAFREGFSCSQAVFAAFSDDFGLDRPLALKISQAMGGGMGHLGQTCGAVTGAFLTIGLKHGRTRAEDMEARDRTYALMKTFTERFLALHGSISCPDLLGCDLGTPAGLKEAQDKNLFQTACASYVKDAAEILEDLLK